MCGRKKGENTSFFKVENCTNVHNSTKVLFLELNGMEKNNLQTGKTTVKQAQNLLFNTAKAYSTESEEEYAKRINNYENSMRNLQ